jgi:hypothetical protein
MGSTRWAHTEIGDTSFFYVWCGLLRKGPEASDNLERLGHPGTNTALWTSGPVRLAKKSWLKVLFTDLLWEKNTICWLIKYGL